MRSCAVRLPTGLFNYLTEQADANGSTVGEMIRKSCELYRDQIALHDTLSQLEARFFRKVFESQCAVVGLSRTEREQAITELKHRLKEPLQ